jgi:hypothetical protein
MPAVAFAEKTATAQPVAWATAISQAPVWQSGYAIQASRPTAAMPM